MPSQPNISQFITKELKEEDNELVKEAETIDKDNWLSKVPEFEPYKHELCALCTYLKNRETGKFKFKFTIATVEKNIISKDASLSKNVFKKLVNFMSSKGYLKPEKASIQLTQPGEGLYACIKANKYQC